MRCILVLWLILMPACATVYSHNMTERGFKDSMKKLKGMHITRVLYKLGHPSSQYAFTNRVDGYEWQDPLCKVVFYVDRPTGTILDDRYQGDCRAEEPPTWELVKEEEL